MSLNSVILDLLLLFTIVDIGKAASPANSNLSPIRSFGPSFASSSIHGTTIVVPYTREEDEDGTCRQAAVLLFRSTSSNVLGSRQTTTSDSSNQIQIHTRDMDGVKLIMDGSIDGLQADDITVNDASSRWTLLGSNTALCSMTGLASDVDFLTRVLQKQADNHRLVYETSNSLSFSSGLLPIDPVVEKLSYLLRDAASSGNGRPYGIQAILIGAGGGIVCQITGEESKRKKFEALRIYSLDPSGGYRHWGCGTAIGRNAAMARKQLYRILTNSPEGEPTSGADALRMALVSSIESTKEEALNSLSTETYDAFLLWQDRNSSLRLAKISRTDVYEAIQKVRNI